MPDISYRFVVAVKNFLREITQKTITVVRRSFPVPRVQVQGDPVLRVFRDQGLYVRSFVSVPASRALHPSTSPRALNPSRFVTVLLPFYHRFVTETPTNSSLKKCSG